jgi:hypothetical protein
MAELFRDVQLAVRAHPSAVLNSAEQGMFPVVYFSSDINVSWMASAQI